MKWAKSSPVATISSRTQHTFLVIWTEGLSLTNLSLTCKAPELRCSFHGLGSFSVGQAASPEHAPGLPWCDHCHHTGRKGRTLPITGSQLQPVWVAYRGAVVPRHNPCRALLGHPVRRIWIGSIWVATFIQLLLLIHQTVWKGEMVFPQCTCTKLKRITYFALVQR